MSLSLRPSLEALVAELKRLRAEGVDSVYLEQETMSRLTELGKQFETAGFADVLAREFGAGGSLSSAGSGASGAAANGGFGESGSSASAAASAGTAGAAGGAGAAKKTPNPFLEDHSFTLPGTGSDAGKAAPVQAAAAGSSAAATSAGAGRRSGGDKAAAQGLPAGVKPIPEPVPFELPEGDKQTRWQWLEQKVKTDPVCLEHLNAGKQLVLGVGSLDAEIFFCGEAPGEDEEEQGEPFVGKAGQLLTKIIQAMGLSRQSVYIGNIMNWRPEHDKPYGNRAPVEAEIRYCLPHLLAQLEIVRPKVIVALGLTAANGLLGHDPERRLGGVRGRWMEVHGYPLMVTYHPSYLLRNDTLKAKRTVWEDLMLVMEKTGMPISDKQRAFFTKG